MQRRATTALLALAAAVTLTAAGPSASAPAPNGSAAPLTSARVAQCLTGDTAADREATFRGSMRRSAGADRMAMRFTLLERGADGTFTAVNAPALKVWRKSRRGVRAFAYRQRVRALEQGGVYRASVAFRWYADGKVVKRAKRRSPPCRQDGRLPDLEVGRIGAKADPTLGPGQLRYTVVVHNRGRRVAFGVPVALSVDGDGPVRRSLGRLAVGEAKAVTFAGPVCQARVEARVDPAGAIAESDESDNVLAGPCPPQG